MCTRRALGKIQGPGGPGPSAATLPALHANSKKNTNTAGEDVATATHKTPNPTDAPSSDVRGAILEGTMARPEVPDGFGRHSEILLRSNERRAASLIGEKNEAKRRDELDLYRFGSI